MDVIYNILCKIWKICNIYIYIYYMASIRFDELCNLIGRFKVGPDFAVIPSAAVVEHYEIFNALQNKTEQVKTVK